MNRIHSIIIFTLGLVAISCQSTEQPLSQEQAVSPTSRKAWTINGVCYHPVNQGDTVRSFDRLDQDLELMKAAGINTIRVYEPITEIEVLDKIANAGMRLAIGFGYNQDSIYDILSGTYIDYVKAYKDHPAIGMWELGNEYNYHPEWFGGDLGRWYDALEEAIDAIHAIDAEHPVSTVHGEIPDSLALYKARNVDLWGFNVYRWDLPGSFVEDWRAVSDVPFYFAEVGADSYMTIAKDGFPEGESEEAQAQAVAHILKELAPYEDQFEGIVIFSFLDGWWKAGNPNVQDIGGWAPNSSGVPYDGAPNEEYWGIVKLDRTPKQAYGVVKNYFTKP